MKRILCFDWFTARDCPQTDPRNRLNPLLTKLVRSVKMAVDIGLVLFRVFLWTSPAWSRLDSIKTQKKNLANIQPS